MDNVDKSVNNSENLNYPEIWEKACVFLKTELSERSFKTWFSPVNLISVDQTSACLAVPDSYYGKWLQDHYETLIQSAFESILSRSVTITYDVSEKPSTASAGSSSSSPESQSRDSDSSRNAKESAKKPVDLNTSYTFDNFVIGPGNRFAHAAAVAVTEAPAKQYNPLFIYGRAGLGKTHLLQGIAHEIKRRSPDFKISYISSEKFMNELISSIQNRSTYQFRSRYRNLDLLLIDDIHFLAEKEATQEEFFHTFNTLYDAHKQIVVTSDRPPKEIPGLEERLVSRFAWGLVTDIHPPNFETRVAILKKKIEKETVTVPDDVCFFIASKIKSNIRELEGALIRVVAYCSLTGSQIDVPLAKDILKDSFKEEDKKFSIEDIQKTVADYFNLQVSDLRAKTRSRSVVKPRQIAMFLVRELTSHSLPEIGSFFGGRDHTTVLHACNKVQEEKNNDISVQNTVDKIRDLLQH